MTFFIRIRTTPHECVLIWKVFNGLNFKECKLINNREAKTSAHPSLRKSRPIFVFKLIQEARSTFFIRMRTTPR